MSLLEDALRRQGELIRKRGGAPPPPAPVPPSGPFCETLDADAPERRATEFAPQASPPTDSPPPSAVPALARVVAVVVPILLLLFLIGFVWLTLRGGRSDGTSTGGTVAVDAAILMLQPTGRGAVPHPPEPTVTDGGNGPSQPAEALPDAAASPGSPSPNAGRSSATVPEGLATGTPPAMAASAWSGADPSSLARVDERSLQSAADEPPAKPVPWPLFTVKGIADGREKLVMLDTGEMLASGERSKTGVRLIRIEPDRVWFVWRRATNALRKGESSEKPLQE
jgi:hypothetical protein